MTSKVSKTKWDRDHRSLLKTITQEDRKLVLYWKGREHIAFNLRSNGKEVHCDCKICNHPIDLDSRYGMVRGVCSETCARTAKGNHFRGRKRPEHSKHMKKKIPELIEQGALWGKSHRKNNSRHLSKLNKEIDRTEHSRILKSVQSRRRSLCRLVASEKKKSAILSSLWNRSSLCTLTVQDVESATDKRINTWSTQYQSMKSLTAMSKNPSMGGSDGSLYKRIRITGLHNYYEGKRRSITVRSFLEYEFVQQLLSQENLQWRYEWTSVKTEFGFTRPDFKIMTNKSTWVVETKGVFGHWRPSPRETVPFENILCVVAFCRDRGYKYTVLNTAQVKSKSGPRSWVDLTEMTDSQVLKYLAKTIPGALDVLVNRVLGRNRRRL